jgi:hypothetical protein
MSTPVRTIVMDNGADTCKVGFGGQAKPLRLVPNCAVRARKSRDWLIGHHQETIQDKSGLLYKRPHERVSTTQDSSALGRIALLLPPCCRCASCSSPRRSLCLERCRAT